MGRLRLEERDEKSTERRRREHGPRIAGRSERNVCRSSGGRSAGGHSLVCCVGTRIGYMRVWQAADLDHKPEIWSSQSLLNTTKTCAGGCAQIRQPIMA